MPCSLYWIWKVILFVCYFLALQTTESDTSLDDGRSNSSDGSLQTTLEDSLNLSDSPQCTLDLPVVLCPVPTATQKALVVPLSPVSRRQSIRGRGIFTLQNIRRHQRSHSSGGSTSPGCTYHDSMDPSDEEGIGSSLRGGGNSSEQSETLSSFSLTSLFSPPPPSQALALVKKCNSTSSLHTNSSSRSSAANEAKQFYSVDPRGFLSMPSWVTDFCKNSPSPRQGDVPEGLDKIGTPDHSPPVPSQLQLGTRVSKRHRWVSLQQGGRVKCERGLFWLPLPNSSSQWKDCEKGKKQPHKI